MEEHNVQTVRVDETTIYKGTAVKYSALYEYCDRADEYIATEAMLSQNHTAMQEAYMETQKINSARYNQPKRLYGL